MDDCISVTLGAWTLCSDGACGEVTRIVLDGDRAGFEFYDGTFERLPDVAHGPELAQLIIHHARRLRIDVTVLNHLEHATRR